MSACFIIATKTKLYPILSSDMIPRKCLICGWCFTNFLGRLSTWKTILFCIKIISILVLCPVFLCLNLWQILLLLFKHNALTFEPSSPSSTTISGYWHTTWYNMAKQHRSQRISVDSPSDKTSSWGPLLMGRQYEFPFRIIIVHFSILYILNFNRAGAIVISSHSEKTTLELV